MLQGHECRKIGLSLQPGHVGMPTDCAGRRTRCIEQDRVEWFRLPLQYVGRHGIHYEAETLEVLAQSVEACGRTVDRRYVRACKSQLGGFSSRCRAQVGDPCPAQVAEQVYR